MRRFFSVLLLLCILFSGVFSYAVEISDYEFVNGVMCKKRQNVLTYLFIGVDDYGEMREKPDDEIPGQCDVLLLLVIDKAADTYAVININRNTITNVRAISDYDGTELGEFPMQIALAHTNGDGLEQSCKVVSDAVSELLMNMRIDHYAAANMDVIGIINHYVGGVSVVIEDDFSGVDDSLKYGETVRLSDTQAETFVRARQSMKDPSNAARMRRQHRYLDSFKQVFLERYHADAQFPLKMVHELNDYLVTDMTDKDFSYIAKAISKNEYLGMFEPDGETEVDRNGWEAFFPYPDSITDIVMKLFYL